MERRKPSEAHSLPGGGRGRYLSGYGKRPTERGTLTLWRWQREVFVRTPKETNRARHTHVLEVAEGGTCQNTERNPSSKAHSHTGEGRERDLLGHGKKPTDQGTLTNWIQQRESLSGYGKN